MILLSKFVIFLSDPIHLFLLGLALAGLLRLLGRRIAARRLATLAGAWIAVCIATPLGDWMLWTLETRAPKPADALGRARGVIILGGAGDIRAINPARDAYALNDAAERLTTILDLRQARPDLPILFSGGQGGLTPEAIGEAAMVRRFLAAVGVDPAAIEYETRSRNTFENAVFSAEQLAGRPGPHLLVTSAAHMPRALGVFRAAGLEVIPYPVDHRQWRPRWSILDISRRRLERMGDAMREYVGLGGYYALGRTEALFPKP